MDFEEYQCSASSFCNHDTGTGIAFELLGEAGEVAAIFQKSIRKGREALTEDEVDKLMGELGDVLWGVANLAEFYGLDLEDIALFNINKLATRLKEGTLIERAPTDE